MLDQEGLQPWPSFPGSFQGLFAREVLFVPGWLVTWSMKSTLAVVAAALAEISIPKLGFLPSSKE